MLKFWMLNLSIETASIETLLLNLLKHRDY